MRCRPISAATLVSFLLISSGAASAQTLVSGTYSSNRTWTTQGHPYVITTSLNIAAGATLTIEPGVIVKFGKSGSLDSLNVWAGGALVANGVPGQPVVFTSIEDDSVGGDTGGDGATTGAPGQWYSIAVSGTAHMVYVDIRYGGYGSSDTLYGAVEARTGSTVTLDHVAARFNQRSGLKVGSEAASVSVVASDFSGNATGISVYNSGISIGGGTTVKNNSRRGIWVNYSNYTGAPMTLTNSNVTDNPEYGLWLQVGSNTPVSSYPYGHENNIFNNGGGANMRQLYPLYRISEADWSSNYWGNVQTEVACPWAPSGFYPNHLSYSSSNPYTEPVKPGPVRYSSHTLYEGGVWRHCGSDWVTTFPYRLNPLNNTPVTPPPPPPLNPFTLTPTAVSFTRAGGSGAGGFDVYKDVSGGATLITNPVWRSINSPAENNPVGYACGTRMTLSVTFTVSPVPSSPISNVTIMGEVPVVGYVRRTGVTVPAGASSIDVADIVADWPFDCTTQFLNPMTINWRHMADGAGCPACVADGSTATPVYVTLATPMQAKVFLTTLHLAVSNEGASDLPTAAARSWSLFADPTETLGISTWDSRPLYYYKQDEGFEACAKTEEHLLTRLNGSGECGSFAKLLIAVFATNGIPAEFVSVSYGDSVHGMLIRDWVRDHQTHPTAADYKWSLQFNSVEYNGIEDPMVPPQPGGVYGDLTNSATLYGQHTAPPSEKLFGAHFIVKMTQNPDVSYYDPSYGVTYEGVGSCDIDAPCEASQNFEAAAIEGYVTRFITDPPGVLRMRNAPLPSILRFNK